MIKFSRSETRTVLGVLDVDGQKRFTVRSPKTKQPSGKHGGDDGGDVDDDDYFDADDIYLHTYTHHVTSCHVNRICRGCAPGFAAAADEAVFARQSLVTQPMEGGVVEEWAETMIDSSVVGLSYIIYRYIYIHMMG